MKEELDALIQKVKALRDSEKKSSESYEDLDMCIDNLIDARLFLGMYYDSKE